jgi:hypothetical protein
MCRTLLSCPSSGRLNIHAVSAALLTSHLLALLVVPLTRALVLLLMIISSELMLISLDMDVTIRSRHSQGWNCAVLSCAEPLSDYGLLVTDAELLLMRAP